MMANLLSTYRKIGPVESRQLDTLRGLSAIAVLVGHSVQIFLAPIIPAISPAFGVLAQAAVMLFFVLSGFLITKSCTRNLSRNGSFDAAAYARDRFNRIYPPLLFALGLVTLLYLLAPHVFPTGSTDFRYGGAFVARTGFQVDMLSMAGTMLFLNGFLVDNVSANGPLWSLSYEVWYYVVAGLMAWRLRAGAVLGLALLLLLGALNKIFLAYSLIWFAGAAVTVLHNHATKAPRRAWAMVVAGLGGALACGGYYLDQAVVASSPAGYPLRLLVLFNLSFGIAAAAALYLLLAGKLHFRAVASASAKYSYTLYVTHFPMLLLIFGATQGFTHANIWKSALIAALSFGIALAVAKAAAPFVENVAPLGRKAKAISG